MTKAGEVRRYIGSKASGKCSGCGVGIHRGQDRCQDCWRAVRASERAGHCVCRSTMQYMEPDGTCRRCTWLILRKGHEHA